MSYLELESSSSGDEDILEGVIKRQKLAADAKAADNDIALIDIQTSKPSRTLSYD